MDIGTLTGYLALEDNLSPSLTIAQTNLEKFAGSAKNAGMALSTAITLPLAAIGGFATKAAIDFESSFAGVAKTTDGVLDSFGNMTEMGLKFQESFRGMAQTIPIGVNQLNAIAEAGGQLGVKSEDLVLFTRTMADMGVATNLSSDQAATSLAQIANIINNEAGPQYDRMGSTIVALGNKSAATESDITSFGLRLAGAGKVAGLSEADILGVGSALASVGINAEAGGTAFSKVMIELAQASESGGAKLENFASVAGMTGADFKKSFETDAAGALATFVKGLGNVQKQGGSLFGTLDALGVTEQRMRDALLRTAGAGDLLSKSIQDGRQAWEDNNALSNEAATRYKTAASQLTILWNQINDVAITIGQSLVPTLLSAVEAIKPLIGYVATAAKMFGELPGPIRLIVIGFLAIVAAIGPIIFILGTLAASISAIIPLFAAGTIGASVLAGSITVLTASFGPLVAVLTVVTLVWKTWQAATAESGFIRNLSDKVEYASLRLRGYSAAEADAAIATEHAMQKTDEAAKAKKELAASTAAVVPPTQAATIAMQNNAKAAASQVTEADKAAFQAKEMARQLDLLRKGAVEPLTESQKAYITEAHNLGMEQSKIISVTGASEAAVHSFIEAQTKAKEEAKKHADALKAVNDKIADFQKGLTPLTAAQEIQVASLHAMSLSASDIVTKTGYSEAAIKTYTDTLDKNKKAVEDNKKKHEEIAAKLADYSRGLQPLIGAEEDLIEEYHKHGLTVSEIAFETGLAESSVKAFTEELDKSAKAAAEAAKKHKDFADKVEAYSKGIAPLTLLQELQIHQYETMGFSIKEISDEMGLNEVAVKASSEAYKAGTKEIETYSKHMGELHKIGDDFYKSLRPMTDEQKAQAQVFLDMGYNASQAAEMMQEAFGGDVIGAQITNQIIEPAKEASQVLSQLAAGFAQLGQIAGGSMGDIMGGVGKSIGMLDMTKKSMVAAFGGGAAGEAKASAANWGNLSVLAGGKSVSKSAKIGAGVQMGTAVVQGVGDWMAASQEKDTGKRLMGETMAGMQAGAAFGPYGMAIGAAAGFVAGLIKGKPGWVKVQDDMARDYGVSVSDELAKAVEETAKSKFKGNTQAAGISMLSDVVKEAGGATAENVGKLTERMRDAFVMVETHQFSVAQGTKVLDDNFAAFAEAGTSATGLLSKGLIEIISLNDKFKTDSKAITEYIGAQGKAGASAFGNALSIGAAAIDAYSASQEELQVKGEELWESQHGGTKLTVEATQKLQEEISKLKTLNDEQFDAVMAQSLLKGTSAAEAVELAHQEMDLEAQLAQAKTDNTDAGIAQQEALKAQIAETHAQWEAQQVLIEEGTAKSQMAADALAYGVAADFEAMIEGGMSYKDAVTAIQPAIDSLQTQMDFMGVTGSDVFEMMKEQVGLYSDEIAGPALDSVDSLTQGMVALDNMGKGNTGTFMALSGQVTATFDELVRQGHNGDTVMLAMKDSLQRMWEEQQEFGYQTDEATQALIDQAEAEGIVGETHKDVNQQMLDATKRMADVLESVAKALGATLPEAAHKGATGVQKELDAIKAPALTVKVNYDDPGFDSSTRTVHVNYDDESSYAATGGLVTSGGVQYLAGGGNVLPFTPRGTDTVPTMLSPGEGVVTTSGMSTLGTAGLAALNSGGASSGGGDNGVQIELQGLRRDLRNMPDKTAMAVRDGLIAAGLRRR